MLSGPVPPPHTGDIPGALRFAEEELAPTGELHPALLEELEDVMVCAAAHEPCWWHEPG